MWHWSGARTWVRSPIVLDGNVLRSGLDELVVGFTRLGNLLGALDPKICLTPGVIAFGSDDRSNCKLLKNQSQRSASCHF
jgi:hypothetical protein